MIRAARSSDVDMLQTLAGSRDRALVRLRAAARDQEAMRVAVVDGQVVGAVSVRFRNDCDPPHPWLYGLAVAPSMRRRGIGRALVVAAEKLCRQRGASHVSLDVDVDDDRAIAFYQRLGYQVVRDHEHHWQAVDPDTGAVTAEGTAATWIMRRHLTAS